MRIRKGIVRAVKLFLALAVLAVLIGAGWWMVQPSLPSIADTDPQEESLAGNEYRAAATASTALIRGVVEELGLPSLSLAVSVEGERVWAITFGFSDVSKERIAGIGTRYRAGSISKAMTGLAVAKLVEAEKLDLDRAVHEYVPTFSGKRWDVTLAQLGSHTGGVRHYANPGEPGFWSEQFSTRHYASVEEALEVFNKDPLLFKPGSDFQYSTHGFTLLSAALEVATDRPFHELMAALVWNPLGMEDTQLDDLTRIDPDRAVPYMAMGKRLIHFEGPDPSYKWAGGGILSTPTDLVRMGGAVLTGRFMEMNLRNALLSPQALESGSPNPQGYALGWRNDRAAGLPESPDSLPVLHHGGSSPGGSSFLLLIPDGAVAVAAMTNLTISNPQPFRKIVYDIAGHFRAARMASFADNGDVFDGK